MAQSLRTQIKNIIELYNTGQIGHSEVADRIMALVQE